MAKTLADRIRLPLACLAAGLIAALPAAAAGGTIGLALTSWRSALHETEGGKQECPGGYQASELEQLQAMPEGIELIRRRGGLLENRGPNGEMGNFNPLAMSDPLPFSELKTTVGYGVNLDGTQDGRATAKTRRHEKFTSPEGEKVDNELARVIGCVIDDRFPHYTLRTRGRIVGGMLITEPLPRALLPISSVRVLGERDMRDMTLRLKLSGDGAEGGLAGYENWRKFYTMHAKILGGSELGKIGGPTFYRALVRYADGYPDPKTGEFAYISAAYKVTAVRAMIVHPGDRNRSRMASSGN